MGSLESLQIVGTPTTAGTYNFTLEATDATSGSTRQALTITVDPAPAANAFRAQLMQNPAVQALAGDASNNSMMAGQFAFLFSGEKNGVAATAAAGSFAADGAGNIFSGIADRNGPSGPQTGLGFTGTYNVGANHLGMMWLNFADGTNAAYAVAASAEGGARFIEFDDLTGSGTRGAGEIAKQDTSAFSMTKLAGNYAFALNGNDANSQPVAMAGTFAAGKSGAISGARLGAGSSISGAYSVDVVGRGSATLNVSGANAGAAAGSLNMSFTVVSAGEWFAVETDAASKGMLAGVMRVGTAAGTAATVGNTLVDPLDAGKALVLVQGSLPYASITTSGWRAELFGEFICRNFLGSV